MLLSRGRMPLGMPSSWLLDVRIIVLAYAVCSLAWVVLSDSLVPVLAPALHGPRAAQVAVDALFVLASVCLLYLSLRNAQRARDAVVARGTQALREDGARWQAAIRAHLEQRAPYDIEFRARHRDGHGCWFHTQAQAIWDTQGRAVYMAGTTFDISEKRAAEEALRRARAELSQLSRRLMEQERETTTRLAQSLHDHLGQLLGGARLHLDLALSHAERDDALPVERVGRVSSMLDEAIAEVRRVLVDLRPPLLQEQGLAAALDNEIRRGSARGLQVDVDLHSNAGAAFARWPDIVEHAAFMIAREGLANALQHARARQVRVHLDGDGDRLELRVEDDGRGIAEDDRHGRPGHLGLVGMRERAASIGAALTVRRGAQGGTTVRLIWTDRDNTT